MKKERFAALLIFLAFFSGMLLTAATSGCDLPREVATESASVPGALDAPAN